MSEIYNIFLYLESRIILLLIQANVFYLVKVKLDKSLKLWFTACQMATKLLTFYSALWQNHTKCAVNKPKPNLHSMPALVHTSMPVYTHTHARILMHTWPTINPHPSYNSCWLYEHFSFYVNRKTLLPDFSSANKTWAPTRAQANPFRSHPSR